MKLSPEAAIGIGVASMGALGLAVWAIHSYAPPNAHSAVHKTESLEKADIPSPPTAVPEVHLGLLDEAELHTLSASLTSGNFWFPVLIATVLMVVTAASVTRRHLDVRASDYVGLTVAALTPAVLILALVDDLPDEAYVWASKAREFSESGTLGVALGDGRFGESTVGTLQFVISGLLLLLTQLTVEQALILPVLAGAGLLGGLSFAALRKRGYQPLIAVLLSISVSSGISAIETAASGFDNYLGLVLFGTWLSLEYLLPTNRIQLARVLIATMAPFVRLEFVVFSVAILLTDLWVNRPSKDDDQSLWRTLWQRCHRWAAAPLIASLWLAYKSVVFGGIVPAMAIYKSPSFSSDALLAGGTYLVQSVGELPFFFLSLLTVWSGLAMILGTTSRNKIYSLLQQNFVVVVVLTIASVAGLLSTLGGGGDYFGPDLARYVFPYLSAWLLLTLLASKFLGSFSGWFRPSLAVVTTTILVTVSLQPSELYPVYRDAKTLETGRATCDYLGTQALLEITKADPAGEQLVVASPEVNGAAFHLGARLVDMIGLVDTQVNSSFAPLRSGDNLHKYQVELGPNSVGATDIVWLWRSSVCDLPRESADNMVADPRQEITSFLADHPASYRLTQAADFFDSGLVPLVVKFSYGGLNDHGHGVVRVLWRPPQE